MTGSQDQTPGAAGAPVSRRRLLAAGTAGAFTIALARSGSFVQTAEAKAPKGQPERVIAPLAIGFNTGMAGDGTVVDAASLGSGDSGFARSGVRVKVLERCPSGEPLALEMVQWLTVDVSYTPYHDTPFLAWSFRNGPVPQSSAPQTITVPVEDPSGLHLLVSYQVAGAAEPVQSQVQLATGQDAGAAKLRAGIYIIALAGTGHELPDWRKHQLVTESMASGSACWRLYEKSRSDYVAARVPHLLVSVG